MQTLPQIGLLNLCGFFAVTAPLKDQRDTVRNAVCSAIFSFT